jgi:hypothetical protein
MGIGMARAYGLSDRSATKSGVADSFLGTSDRRPAHHPPDPEWLKVGVWEDGVVSIRDGGTGQGSVISRTSVTSALPR